MEIHTFEQRFQAGLDLMAALPLAQARRHYDKLCASFAPARPARMRVTDGRIGTTSVRHYRPAHCHPGQILYVHGGGFSLGSLDSHQGVAEGLAAALEREVVSIDYRLMPEAGYADALDDCRTLFEALRPVALVGDSAGARLLLDLIIEVAAVPPLGLIYPLLGVPTEATLGPDAPLLSRQDVIDSWNLIAADAPLADPLAPPADCVDVLAVGRDPLTRPLEQAVAAWRQAGAEVNWHFADNMLHGCLHARESLPEMADAWQRFCTALGSRLI